MPIIGWIDGIASETLPMSVEPAVRSASARDRGGAELPAERLGVTPIERGELGVVLHLRIRRALGLDGEGRAGRERAGLEAAEDLGLELVELVERAGADDVSRRGDARGRCWGHRRRGDDAVDAVGLPDVLAQQPDGRLGDGEGVGGVDAPLGKGRRRAPPCRCSAPRTATRRGRAARQSTGARVDHHGDVDAREDAAVEQQDLAAAALLGRRPDDGDGEPDVVGDARRAQSPAPTAIAAIMLWPQA